MMDFIRSNVLKAKINSEIDADKVKSIDDQFDDLCEVELPDLNLRKWFNSTRPEYKLMYIYSIIGLPIDEKYLAERYMEDPEKYLEMMEVVKNWKF